MTGLEKLDLSHNKLSGEIPRSLVNLSFVSTFNISYNHLCGEIPEEGQLDTFPSASFEGNSGLCRGEYCTCQSDRTPIHSPREKKRIIIGLPFEIGAATGFVLTVIYCFMSGLSFP
nr:phytosulfokine receptor 1 [Quercus suber]